MNEPRFRHTATLLLDGRVLVAGGFYWNDDLDLIARNSVEIFDPAAGTFSLLGAMDRARGAHTATLLTDGRVLLVSDIDAEVFDPFTNSFSPPTALITARASHYWGNLTSTLAAGDVVLVAGGSAQPCCSASATAEFFDPVSGMFFSARDLRRPRMNHAATRLSDGRVVITAATRLSDGRVVITGGAYDNSAEIYD